MRVSASPPTGTQDQDLQALLGRIQGAAVLGMGEDGRLAYWNSGAEALFGWKAREVLGWRTDFLLRGGDGQRERREAVLEGSAYHEGWYVRNDGSSFWGSGLLMKLLDAQGAPIGIVKIIRDITPAHHFQEHLGRFLSLADHANEGLVVTDEGGTLVYANRLVHQLLGYEDQELLGLCLFGLQKEKDAAGMARWLAASRERPEQAYETTLVRKDGAPLAVEVTAASGTHGEEPLHLLAIRSPVARRRHEKAEQQQRRSEGMEQLAGGMAHDFNNLLTAAINYAELALDESEGNPPQKVHLERLQEVMLRFSGLTRKMLDYSGRGSMARRPVDLNALVGRVVSRFETTAPAGFKVTLELDPDRPVVPGDEGRIEEALMNLMLNGLEAGKDGRMALVLRTGYGLKKGSGPSRMIPARPTPRGAEAWVEVEDSGGGMTQDALDRLFEPFYSTKAKGRGLGLPAVHGILRAHGGDIQVETVQGRGTTFRLLFPL